MAPGFVFWVVSGGFVDLFFFAKSKISWNLVFLEHGPTSASTVCGRSRQWRSMEIEDFDGFGGFHEIWRDDHHGYTTPLWSGEFFPSETCVSEVFEKVWMLFFMFICVLWPNWGGVPVVIVPSDFMKSSKSFKIIDFHWYPLYIWYIRDYTAEMSMIGRDDVLRHGWMFRRGSRAPRSTLEPSAKACTGPHTL